MLFFALFSVFISPMQKSIFIPLIAVTAMVGCGDHQAQSEFSSAAKNQTIEKKVIVPEWVGKYQGTTPCMGCFSRCDECPGMSVELTLKADQTFVLSRLSLSGHNEIETLKGKIKFTENDQSKLELENVTTRNLLFVDLKNNLLEILEDKTSNAYVAFDDFSLEKTI